MTSIEPELAKQEPRGTVARTAPSAAERMGVLFIQTATMPPLGADIWVHALIMKHLERARFEVHAACTPGEPGSRTPAFEALSAVPELALRPVNLGTELFGRSRLRRLAGALEALPAAYSLAQLARYVRARKIAVLHTSDRPRDALACVLLGQLTGAKSVIQVHVEYGDWMSPLLRWAMKRADALIGVSRFVADSLIAAGHRRETTHVALNAIEVDRWDPELDGRPVRVELGLPAGAPVVACVGRIFSNKGQAALIRAVAALRGELPELRLLIAGQDYPAGTHHSRELKALATSLGVERQILFTGQRRDVDRILAASDLFAMPSHREPFGLVYAEAMAMRRPVVALGTGGVPEVVEHGKSGLLSAAGDEPALIENLRALAGDPALRLRMGAHGRQAVESRFSPQRLARDIERIYALTAGARGAGPAR